MFRVEEGAAALLRLGLARHGREQGGDEQRSDEGDGERAHTCDLLALYTPGGGRWFPGIGEVAGDLERGPAYDEASPVNMVSSSTKQIGLPKGSRQ